MCDSALTTDCVVNVQAKDAAGKNHIGKFVENFPGKTAYTFTGDAKVGLPTGSSSFIVEFADLPHAGGNQYLVVVFLHGTRAFGEATFTLDGFKVAIYAVSKVTGSFSMPGPELNIRPDHKLNSRVSRAGGFNQNQLSERRSACVKTSAQACALPWPLNLENTFELTMKLSQPVNGWLHGRLLDAESVITKASDGDQLLSIKGKPVVVPGI
jgi:hypothetical protein